MNMVIPTLWFAVIAFVFELCDASLHQSVALASSFPSDPCCQDEYTMYFLDLLIIIIIRTHYHQHNHYQHHSQEPSKCYQKRAGTKRESRVATTSTSILRRRLPWLSLLIRFPLRSLVITPLQALICLLPGKWPLKTRKPLQDFRMKTHWQIA